MLRTLPRLTVTTLLLTASAAAFILAGSLGLALAHRITARGASASGARIGLRRTGMGKLLVNRRGFTVYVFSRDGRGKDRCAAISGCAQVWPFVATKGRPRAGAGLKASHLGSIRLRGGRRQVTYFGHPLYTYSQDIGPGQTSYVGVHQFRGVWRAMTATGKTVG